MNMAGAVGIIIGILFFIQWALWDIRKEIRASNEIRRQIIFLLKQIEK